jgi:LPS O-antigen subunit length determinant protein (WzzB/FepE family)
MASTRTDEGEFANLRLVISRIRQRKVWLLMSVLAFSLLFAAVAFLSRPIYRATVVLAPSGTERLGLNAGIGGAGSLSGLAQLAGLSLGSLGSSTEEALAVLQSRQLTETFLTDNLLLPILYASKWNAEKQVWVVPKDKQPNLAIAFKYFDRKIRTVSNDRRTGLIRLSIEWTDADRAAEWANILVALVNAEMRSRARLEAEASVRHLENELTTTANIETRQAISRLLEAQVNRRMIATVTNDYAFRVIDAAMAPDARDFVRPRRLAMLILGPLLGAIFGVGLILSAASLSHRPES